MLLASTAHCLEVPFAAAKLQWQATARDTTVLLLTETEGAEQTIQPMWPVGAAMEALLNEQDNARAVVCCLPFATGPDCSTFGLRRYEKPDAVWSLGSAASVGSCRAAAEALHSNRDGGANALRCAELAVEAKVVDGVLGLAGFACDAASQPVDVATVANALGLAAGRVVYAASTPSNALVVEVEDAAALAEATLLDAAALPGRVLATAAGDDGFTARCLAGDDALTAAVSILGLYWTAREKLDVGPPLNLSIDGQELALTLSPPPKPKMGGFKRKGRVLPRLPSVAVAFPGSLLKQTVKAPPTPAKKRAYEPVKLFPGKA